VPGRINVRLLHAISLCSFLFLSSSISLISYMTRSDLVEELAARFGQLTHRDAEYAVKTILDAMSDALVRGHRIEIRGFGSFSINRRSPRMGRNPRSGESVAIPEKRVPHFKPGKALREAVDARTEELLAATPQR
jgi:integration host factor subunit beta